jgi:polyhydroxyalkanoate synthesis regulator phasin
MLPGRVEHGIVMRAVAANRHRLTRILNYDYQGGSIMKTFVVVYFTLVFSILSLFSFSQPIPSMQDFSKQEEQYLKRLEKTNPEVAQMKKRMSVLMQEVQVIADSFVQGKITENAAREKLLPLFKEMKEIRDDADYQLETQMAMILQQASFQKTIKEMQRQHNLQIQSPSRKE